MPGAIGGLRRFYAPPEQIREDRALLLDEEARHVRVTLRMNPGDELAVLDGMGRAYRGRIEALGKDRVVVRIEDSVRREEAPRFRFTLASALIRNEKMKWVLQKATELGVTSIRPFVSQRCVARSGGPSWMERNRRILVDAVKQCGRLVLPELFEPVAFEELIAARSDADSRILLWEGVCEPLKNILSRLNRPEHVLAVVGPEGGFTPEEVRLATSEGFAVASLGAGVLRAETAAVALAGILGYEFGDPVRQDSTEDTGLEEET